MQLLELHRVSSRVQCVLQDYVEAFITRILTAGQFAAASVAADPHYISPVALGAAVGGSANCSLPLPSTLMLQCAWVAYHPPRGCS